MPANHSTIAKFQPCDEIAAVKQLLRCWAEVDLGALRENLLWIRNQVGSKVKIMTVVKADAYGHGLKQIAALLMQSGTDIFGVANLQEARTIRNIGPGWPVLMLGPCLPEERETAVRDQIMPTLSSFEEAEAFSLLCAKFKKQLSVHLKVDTGMGRLGVSTDGAFELLQKVKSLPGLRVDGLFTHFASVEDDPKFSARQEKKFSGLLEKFRKAKIEIPLIHANNSGGILHQTGDMGFNLVRPGLLVYGVVPSGSRKIASALSQKVRPVLSFKCRVGFVKTVPAGTTISYGRTFKVKSPMKVATITAGYGDGFLRAGSNKAQVLIDGTRCKVLGRITMDQTVVDVTHLEKVVAGEEVVIVGSQQKETITAAELAAWCETIPWEILTAITYRVPRIYRGGEAS